MPIKKGKGCVAKVMHEWKAGTLHSGKDGDPVKDQQQAVAIALSMCGKSKPRGASYEELASKLLSELRTMPERSPNEFDLAERPVGNRPAYPFMPGMMGLHSPKFESAGDDCGCGPGCGCKSCRAKFCESGAIRRQPALGYPTPQFDEEGGEEVGGISEELEMLMGRLSVIRGLSAEIESALASAAMGGGEVEMERWMQDKITLAADYLSAVANQAKYGGGIEAEDEGEVDEGEFKYGRVYGGGGYPGFAEGKA